MNKRTLALIPDVKRVLALAKSLENRGLPRRDLCGIIMGKPASLRGRPPLHLTIGQRIRLNEAHRDIADNLRGILRIYRKELRNQGDIDKAMKLVRNRLRHNRAAIPSGEWEILEPALRCNIDFNITDIAAKFVGLSIPKAYRDMIVSQLRNRRILPSPKQRTK